MQKLQKLDFDHLDEYYAFTNRYDCFSDLNFTSLMTWGGEVGFSIDESGLVVVFPDYESDAIIITCLSEGTDASELILEVEKMAQENDYIIDAVPGVVINSLTDDANRYKLSADQSDYVYLPSSQLELIGNDYSWYRRKLSLLHREFGNEFNVTVQRLSNFDQKTLNSFNQIWQNWTKNINDKEIVAIQRYIDFREKLINQSVITVEVNGIVEAYTFVEAVHGLNSSCLIHYFKTNNAMEGMANFLFQEIAKFSAQNDLKYINFEQDVGEQGLRTFKTKLVPDLKLEKFTFTEN